MRRLLPVMSIALFLVASAAGSEDQSDVEKQADLDRRCEVARDKALGPIRDDIYKDCLEKKRGDQAYCRRDADGYNGERIGGSPRFYELPECELAFEFRNRERR